MFFPELIRSIGPKDRVLEVGPGGTPFPRADVLLDRIFPDEDHARKQRGGLDNINAEKKVVFYDGGQFPFKDNEFDYVVCSHVIEHVVDVEFFLSELSRVAPRGYIEYPTIYYEYLYNFSVHVNFVKYKNNRLHYLAKKDTTFNEFLPVQKFFYRSLEMGYSQLADAFKHIMFEGFEWRGVILVARATSISDLVFDELVVPKYQEEKAFLTGRISDRIKKMIMKVCRNRARW